MGTEGRSDGRRPILRLSASAFVVLAAEPAFVLVDTAVVGHLGAASLAGLAVGGALLSLAADIGAFLDYGTTGRAARSFGAGRRGDAVDEGVTATVLAVVLGVVGAVAGEAAAGPLVGLLAGANTVARSGALEWFRVAVMGLPAVLVVLAGNGWMRGVQDARRPVVIVVVANVASAIASPVLVYALGLGLVGSAIANVAGQVLGAALFLRALRAEGRPLRLLPPMVRGQLVVARDLLLRAAGFQASFLVAAAVATRMGTAVVAAHQIGFQLWNLVALLLDSFAIAAQSLVGAALGGHNPAVARRTALQVARWGLAAGAGAGVVLGAGYWWVPEALTTTPAVVTQAHRLWPFLAGMEPAAGVLFALDGVLIGAGDVAFMRTLTLVAGAGVFIPLCVAASHFGWGIRGLWAGLAAFVVARLAGMCWRASGDAWSRSD